MTGTYGQPIHPLWTRALSAPDTGRLPITDTAPLEPDGSSWGVVISGEVRCHIGASTTSLSPAPRAGYPATLAGCYTSSTSARSSVQHFGIADAAVSIAGLLSDWRMPRWIT